MRPLVISALAATLIGCTCFGPQQAQLASLTGCREANGSACSDEDASTPQVDSKPLVLHDHPVAKTKKTRAAKKGNAQHRRKATTHTKNTEFNITSKSDASASVRPKTVTDTKSIIAETKTDTPQSSQLDGNDPVIKKAKKTIAEKMGNPESVEFVEMKRAARKDALDKPIDAICGYVRKKNASGGESGDRPFLYLVQKDEAYIGDMIETTDAYRYLAICLVSGRN